MEIKKIVLATALCIPAYQYGVSYTPRISDQCIEKAVLLCEKEAPHYWSCARAIPGIKNNVLKKVLALTLIAQITEASATKEIKQSQVKDGTHPKSPLTTHWRNSLPDTFYDIEEIVSLENVFKNRARQLIRNKCALFICTTYTRIFLEALCKKKKLVLSEKIAALINEENVVCAPK